MTYDVLFYRVQSEVTHWKRLACCHRSD